MKRNRGITLIALIITIIVLLILSGITLAMVTGENKILKQTVIAKEQTRADQVEEAKDLWLIETKISKYTGDNVKTLDDLLTDLLNRKLLTSEEVNKIKANENKEITIGNKTISFGTGYESWDEVKKVNKPKIEGTGLIPVYYNESKIAVELTNTSTKEQWDKWYDYEKNIWANAITKDINGKITGYFVWIPRFAYKITSNLGTNTKGSIQIKFLKGTSNKDSQDISINKTYPEVLNNAMEDYVVHPAFTDGNLNKFQNGEWDKEIEGFWIAKYEAGFQKSTTDEMGTLINGNDEVVYSNYNYTSYNESYIANAISQDLSEAGYLNQKLSYPVFKPLTYAYNVISTGDSYTISREIEKATNFYGLTNINSHMIKNSEWGAVAYLTQSKYGRNENKVTINDKAIGDSSKVIYGITGYAQDRALGVDASTTNNMYGVFDLNGGVWERTSGYITNGNPNLNKYGASYAYQTAEENPITRSTKYATAYPYNSSSDTKENNYNNLKSNFFKKRYGDSILEATLSGATPYTNSWYNELSIYAETITPFLMRGGCFAQGTAGGLFCIGNSFRRSNKSIWI